MKKLIEDAERKTIQAIQFVATFGLRVEDSYSGFDFWQDVVEYSRKGKVREDELKSADDEIRNFTGWNDPVETLSTIAQMNVQDLLMEEKRKKVEEDNQIKRHETLEQKRKEMGEGDVEPKEAEKVKGKTDPSFKLASDIKATTNIKHVTEEVIGMCATTLQVLDGGTINATNVKTISDDGIHEGDMNHYTREHWVRATREASTKIGEQQIPCIALIDHGLEINMMSSKFYAQGRWSIDKNRGWKIRVVTQTTKDLFGACPGVKVTIGDVSVNQNFFVQD